jgi:ABC-2 type transport system ATP-binding protein
VGEQTLRDTTTSTELKKRFPPAQKEYVEKQPTLEEIFLAIIGKKEAQ